MKKLTTEEFVRRAKEVHADTYLYDKTEYTIALHSVTITCRIHGDFQQNPYNHMGGKGCRKCGFIVSEPRRKVTTEQFIEKARKVHGSTYCYDKFVYTDNNTKSTIICPKHGEFQQAPNPHLHYQGCPTCKLSKGERKIASILENLGVNFVQQKRFEDCVDLASLPFDFAILENDEVIGLIEFQGIHHYKPISTFGGEKNHQIIIKHDNIKKEFCAKNQIPLLCVNYLDTNIQWLVSMFIRQLKASRERLKYQENFILEKFQN